MSTITTTIAAKPGSGVLGKVLARAVAAWEARRAAMAFAGLSERELQDIGWGQPDRYSHALNISETPPERRARAAAVAAWHRPQKKAA
jgi:hypothetical protein